MDPDAYDALLECVGGGAYDKCETVPAGDDYGFLIQPIGGIAVENTGPARYGDYLPRRSQAFTRIALSEALALGTSRGKARSTARVNGFWFGSDWKS